MGAGTLRGRKVIGQSASGWTAVAKVRAIKRRAGVPGEAAPPERSFQSTSAKCHIRHIVAIGKPRLDTANGT